MGRYSVSSAYLSVIEAQQAKLHRKFTIGTSDYSASVVKWPKFSRSWNDVKFSAAEVSLSNHGGEMDFLLTSPVEMTKECSVELGATYTTGSGTQVTEYQPIFKGSTGRASFGSNGTIVGLRLINKFKTFGERIIGDRENPVDLTTSNYLPSDIAWTIVTCYGGLSSVKSSSNPDIHYESFQDWSEVFSSDSVFMHAHFDGQKVQQALRKLGRMTDSSIVDEAGLIVFGRLDTSSTEAYEIAREATLSGTAVIDDTNIVNKQFVNAGYDVDSSEYTITVYDQDTTSTNSYGLREQVEEDKNIWYVNSVSALNLAQRITDVNANPSITYKLKFGVQPAAREVGETIKASHPKLGLSGDVFRIMGYDVDLEKGEYQLSLNDTQLSTFFTLDHSSLGLLDYSTNPLG